MQCGICRIPFKLEYFGNDVALIQIYENKMLEYQRTLNNNEILNIRISQSNRNIYRNNNSNVLYFNRPNERDIQLQELSQNNDNTFIILFHPNKFICIATLLVNILISGLGTLILAVKNLNLFEFFLSLMQFCFCYPLITRALEIKKHKLFKDAEVGPFLWIYFFCLAGVFYLSSIYIGIFHNFVFFNPRKIKNKEKGISIIILNILIGGVGTIFYGIIAEGIKCCERIKMWIVGFAQFFGFLLLISILSFSNSFKIDFFFLFIIIGSLSYISAIYLGIKLHIRIYSNQAS